MRLYLLLLLSILNLAFGQINIERFVAFNGQNTVSCGTTPSYPCKSIEYAINQIRQYNYEYDEYSIEILLGRGEHSSPNPTNLYGLNITIGAANPNELVQFSVSSQSNGLSPQFAVKYAYESYSLMPTNIVFRDISITGCNSIEGSELGSFFQSNIGVNDNVFLNVQMENVNFICSTLLSPYFSVSNNYAISGDSSDYSYVPDVQQNEIDSSYSSGSSSNYPDYSESSDNYDYSSSSYNDYSESSDSYDYSESSDNYDYSSSSYNGYSESSDNYDYSSSSYNGYSESSDNNNNNNNSNDQGSLIMTVVDQTFGMNSYPNDNINISFTFNNCQFGYASENTYAQGISSVVLTSDQEFTVDLTITNTQFNSLYFQYGPSLAQLNGGSFTMNNVSINVTLIPGKPLFSFDNARISLNQVNLSGTFVGGSILQTQNCIVSANQFNVLFNSINQIYNHVIILDDSFAYFENSTIIVTVPIDYYSGNYDDIGVFNPINSELYLFSNRISSNGSSIIYSQSSTVWANNNQFKYAPYSVNVYQLVNCDKADSKFIGDSSFTLAADSCQNENGFAFWNPFNLLEVTLSFLSGVLFIVIIFIIMFSVSAIAKCSRRKRKAMEKLKKEREEEAKSLLSVNSQ